jgi:hypothetical protein
VRVPALRGWLSLSPIAFFRAVRTAKLRVIDHLDKTPPIRGSVGAEQLQRAWVL